MNPHFIFNALQSAQGFILAHKIKDALIYIGNIASIIRTNLETASMEYVHLSAEIEFLKKYIEIEKVRFKDILNVEIINSVEESNILLPPMLIQPLIENAVKHGIRGLNRVGHITVTFQSKDETLTVEVKDNGVGMEYAQKFSKSEHNGMSIKIIQQRLSLLNIKNSTNLHQIQFFDLHESGSPSGTRVEIRLMLTKPT